MLYQTTEIPVALIYPPHEVRDCDKLATITASMDAQGWEGRPLLVVRIDEDYFLSLTGSHRIAAAEAAELGDVPCYVLDLKSTGYSVKYRPSINAHIIWSDEGYALTDQGEILDMLQEINNPQALALMQEEIEANENA